MDLTPNDMILFEKQTFKKQLYFLWKGKKIDCKEVPYEKTSIFEDFSTFRNFGPV